MKRGAPEHGEQMGIALNSRTSQAIMSERRDDGKRIKRRTSGLN